MSGIKTFFETMKRSGVRYRGFMVFYVFVSVAVSVATVMMTYLRGGLGEAALSEDIGMLLLFLLLVTGSMVVRAIASALSALFLGRFSASAGYRLRENFIYYFLRVPFSKFEKAGSGESLSIFSNDVPRAATLIAEGGMVMVSDIIYFIASLAFMFFISPMFTGILLAIIPVLVILQVLCSQPIQKRVVVQSEEMAKFNAVVNDSLQNVSTIAAYSLEDVLEERYLSAYDRYMVALKGYAKALLGLVSVGFVAAGIPVGVISVVAAFSVINGGLSIAEFISFTAISLITIEWLGMLSQNLNNFQTAVAGAKRLNENTAEALEELDGGVALEGGGGVAISFRDVTFAYNDSSPPALDGVSFDIAPGARVAFVGGSGSGKSTVLKLLLGLYEPGSGGISIAGVDAGALAKGSLRDAIAYVPQDSFLFPESIGGNITLGSEAVDAQRLDKACTDAGILDFIKSLPDGFDGVLSESAENISGGQRQRIAMARAFYKDAPVILFDEATSALDPITEAAIFESFDAVAGDRTVIMVAHRTRAIAACDTIVVMDEGRVSGIGGHEELLAGNAVYQGLYEAQRLMEEMEEREVA